MAQVELRRLCKRYPGGFLAVDGIDLQVQDQEFVVLVGPSGCGKSTTLRLIAGLEEISGGDVLIDGKRVNEVAPRDRDIAMVFQNYALYPHMNVRQNLAFGLERRLVHRSPWRRWLSANVRIQARDERAALDARVQHAAGMLGLEDLLDRRPGELSGGQRQRVAVGRALVRDPAVFLFDEPLSNLDAKLRVEMRAEIKRLQQQVAVTTVYVTHDQEEAMTLGDRLVVMEGGRIQQIGTPDQVYRRPVNRFVAAFVGTPPMNFLEGSGLQEVFPEAPAQGAVGIRPDRWKILSESESPPPGHHLVRAQWVHGEYLGDRSDWHLRHPLCDPLVCRTEMHAMPEAGAEVRLAIAAHDLHFFDATGQRVE